MDIEMKRLLNLAYLAEQDKETLEVFLASGDTDRYKLRRLKRGVGHARDRVTAARHKFYYELFQRGVLSLSNDLQRHSEHGPQS
jgi:hypothetical protein